MSERAALRQVLLLLLLVVLWAGSPTLASQPCRVTISSAHRVTTLATRTQGAGEVLSFPISTPVSPSPAVQGALPPLATCVRSIGDGLLVAAEGASDVTLFSPDRAPVSAKDLFCPDGQAPRSADWAVSEGRRFATALCDGGMLCGIASSVRPCLR